jgi:phosphatidylserine/phosphatidylglycerophosphate/cardiolipin synthase-like enzyme
MDAAPSFRQELLQTLQSRASSADQAEELPSYDAADPSDIDLLVSSSTPVQLQLGTGADIYTSTLIPAILSAQQEVVLVTCFWAKSKTLSALSEALESLASHRQRLVDGGDDLQPLRVHICFSSRSLFQKLFHTSCRQGYTYPPSSWSKVLGLPAAGKLDAGRIALHVKTLFFLPFSVMHPKFLIIDRQRAFVPSCNVSWEAWLEGCVEITGPAVLGLLDFFKRMWNKELGRLPPLSAGRQPVATASPPQEPVFSNAHHWEPLSTIPSPVFTVILPSSHHRNPRFRPFPWQASPSPPATPLNVAMLHLINNAMHSIFVQTPNITCPTVLSAVLDALGRGVDVTIVTSRNMMLIEQLLTAGTTTSWCIRSLVRQYQSLVSRASGHTPDSNAGVNVALQSAVEAQPPRPGQLRISYFHPRQTPTATVPQQPHGAFAGREEPVHSHLKLTIVDDEYTVLGSGNMDRASWFTSQELGILFQSRHFAAATMNAVSEALVGRRSTVFEST